MHLDQDKNPTQDPLKLAKDHLVLQAQQLELINSDLILLDEVLSNV